MGEMADYYLDQQWDDEDEWGNWIIDPSDGGPPTSTKTCRCCGKTGLHWDLRDGKWRLFDGRGIHSCKVNPLPSNSQPS